MVVLTRHTALGVASYLLALLQVRRVQCCSPPAEQLWQVTGWAAPHLGWARASPRAQRHTRHRPPRVTAATQPPRPPPQPWRPPTPTPACTPCPAAVCGGRHRHHRAPGAVELHGRVALVAHVVGAHLSRECVPHVDHEVGRRPASCDARWGKAGPCCLTAAWWLGSRAQGVSACRTGVGAAGTWTSPVAAAACPGAPLPTRPTLRAAARAVAACRSANLCAFTYVVIAVSLAASVTLFVTQVRGLPAACPLPARCLPRSACCLPAPCPLPGGQPGTAFPGAGIAPCRQPLLAGTATAGSGRDGGRPASCVAWAALTEHRRRLTPPLLPRPLRAHRSASPAARPAAAPRWSSGCRHCWRWCGPPPPPWPPPMACAPTAPRRRCRGTAPAPPCGPWAGWRWRCGREPASRAGCRPADGRMGWVQQAALPSGPPAKGDPARTSPFPGSWVPAAGLKFACPPACLPACPPACLQAERGPGLRDPLGPAPPPPLVGAGAVDG